MGAGIAVKNVQGLAAIEQCVEDYRNRVDSLRNTVSQSKRALIALEKELADAEVTYRDLASLSPISESKAMGA